MNRIALPFIFTMALAWSACGHKHAKALETSATDCKDTAGQVVFLNSQKVKMKVVVSILHSHTEGNKIIENWKQARTLLIQPGDSSIQSFNHSFKYMMTVYGPTAANFNGMGEIASRPFQVEGCKKRREIL
jgi:hypothetical protein